MAIRIVTVLFFAGIFWQEPTFLEGLPVESSPNVFMENLHSTRNLETTYYVTHHGQSVDFFWVRESGLKVYIGIFDIRLIPEYEDVDHESDSYYMLSNPNMSQDKTRFREIVNQQCRHPIPDYYSMTLEIARDRVTSAQEVVCDSTDEDRPPCPPDYRDGDIWLNRSLNDACQELHSFPEPLITASNSIVCNKDVALLKEIFNQSYTEETLIKLLNRDCQQAQYKCKQCLNQLRCQLEDILGRHCSQADCDTLQEDCKAATRRDCAEKQVRCAMGGAYRYTLQPVFKNLNKGFTCHLKQKRHKVLYNIFYHVMIPGPAGNETEAQINTPRTYQTIYNHNSTFQMQGHSQLQYLSVEHTTGMVLEDEFIIKAQQERRWNYTVYPLKEKEDFSRAPVEVHEISRDTFVASTQVDTPFGYSTSSWARGNDCDKDVERFSSVQPQYVEQDAQNVKVLIQAAEPPYVYHITSPSDPPNIRFNVPGRTSVLSWHYKDGPYLYDNDSLRVDLELVAEGKMWSIYVEGLFNGCPGYAGITIVDLLRERELVHYDILVHCPPQFNMTFKVPNRRGTTERHFDVRIEDSHQTLYPLKNQELLAED